MFEVDAAKFFEATLITPIAEFLSTKHEITLLKCLIEKEIIRS